MKSAYEMYSDFLFLKAGHSGIPLSGTFELTSRCNLDCRMCYIHRREHDAEAVKGEWSARQWIHLAEVCRDAGMLILLLTGGEPLLRPDFREIYTECRKLGLMVSVNSNGTLMDESMVEFLAKDPPSRVNITLYGASPETYGALCGEPKAYQKAMDAILALKESGVLVKINFSVTPYNRQDAVSIYQFAKEQNLPLQAATYMFPPARACEQGSCGFERMDPQQAAQAQICYDRFRFPEEELIHRWQNQLNGVRVPDPDSECQELPTEKIRCRAGSSTFWVTWDGKVRPCGMMTVPDFGLRNAEDFTEVWKQIRMAREEILFPARCSQCRIRHVCDMCPALCYTETGSFTDVPDYACKKAEAYLGLAERELNLQK